MPVDELVFRDYRPEDKAHILALLGGGRPGNYARDKLAVFDWQFFSHPQSQRRSPFIIGTVNDEIAAVNGLMRVSAQVGGASIEACWSLDTYVSAHYRGRGFGKALIERVSVSAPVMLAFGISDMSDPIFEKCRWQLDPSMAALFYHSNEIGPRGLSKNLLTRTSRFLRVQRTRPAAQISVEAALPCAELDDLWTRVAKQYPNAVERKASYLTWRYRDAPVLRYRWLAAWHHGELCGLLITRHHPIESVVVDYVGPLDEPALLESLIEAACSDLVAAGTQRIRCETNHPHMLRALAAAGFFRYRTAGRFRARSNLASTTASSARWFIMTGDSDNDLLAL